jgi:hypothetical protein
MSRQELLQDRDCLLVGIPFQQVLRVPPKIRVQPVEPILLPLRPTSDPQRPVEPIPKVLGIGIVDG